MRSFPMIRAGKPTIFMCLLTALPLLLMSLSPVTGMTSILLIFFLTPCLICICGLWAGALAMLVATLAPVLSMALCFGVNAALLAALYLLPYVCAFVIVVQKEIPFFRGAAIMAGTLLLSQAAAFMMISQAVGGNVYREVAERAANVIKNYEGCDYLLLSLQQSGAIGLPASLRNEAIQDLGNGYIALTDLGRHELLLSVTSLVEDYVSTFPSVMVSNSILFGVGGLGLSLYIGRIAQQRRDFRRERDTQVRARIEERKAAIARGETPKKDPGETAQDFRKRMEQAEDELPKGFPDLKMPQLCKWALPRGVGLKVGLLALGYLPAMMSTSPATIMVGQMMTAIFGTVYMIQGMAALNFIQRKAGVRANGRRATLVIIYIIFSQIFQWIGVLEQILNFRALRPPLFKNMDGDGED